MLVERYAIYPKGANFASRGASTHPDRLRVSENGRILLDISMSGDSPLRPFLSAETRRPWFYTGSPFGKEILAFAKECGIDTPSSNGDET